MESTNEGRDVERVISPTVSREKWFNHACSKLLRGYALIVSSQRRNANFFKPEKGYEMCAFGAARRLIEEGIVVEAGTHYLGALYVLSEAAAAELQHRARPARPRAEEVTDVVEADLPMDELDVDDGGEADVQAAS